MSSLFLFGAGASYGSGPCHPHAPPLGSQLFSKLQVDGSLAATFDEDWIRAFDDFEAGMDRFWAERNTETVRFLRDMARFFAPFEPLPGNAYLKLFKILGGIRKKAVMVTTNYDLLIEMAAGMSNLPVCYKASPPIENHVPVLKIHGSCNFLPDVENQMQFQDVLFDLSQAPNASIMRSDIKIAQNADEVTYFCNSQNSIAPALAMYSPSKHALFGKDFLIAQQDMWQQSLSEASRIYVIGLRVHTVDEHIWGPLARASAPIHYVGFEPKVFAAWAEETGRKQAYVLADSFEAALPGIAAHHGYRKPF